MCSSSFRRLLATAAAVALIPSEIAASSHHRRSVPPFQIKPTHQLSAKTMSGIPSISWPNAHANETYVALGIEMPIVGIVGTDPELIFLGAESYLLFMQEGMSMSAYNHLNISDNLLSSSIDPLISFNEPSGIFSESPFSSSAVSDDLRLLAVLLYKSDTQQQGQSSSTSMASSFSSSSSSSSPSSADVLSKIDDFLSGETQETGRGDFNWNVWANDMNANPLLRMNFDISDFAAKAGLGTPIAAEVLIVKDDIELTDSLDVSGGWDVVSTLYQTGGGGGGGNNAAGTATALGPVASGMGLAATGVREGTLGLGLMPSGAGAGSGLGAVATGSPLTSTGPDESDGESDDDKSGAEPTAASGSSAGSSAAGGSQYMNASPSGGGLSGGLVVVPVASSNPALGAASTGRPLNSTTEGPSGASSLDAGSDDDDTCDDDGSDSSGAGVNASGGGLSSTARPTGAAGSVLGASGMPQQPKYSFPQYSGAAGEIPSLLNATGVGSKANAAATAGVTPTESATRAGITGSGGGKAAAEQVTIDIDIDGEFATTITANLKYRNNARRTVDAQPGWTLTLKTDLVAPTSPIVARRAEASTSTVVPTSTPYSFPQYVYRHESSTLRTTATTTTASPSVSASAAASSFVTTSSAVGFAMPAQMLPILGVVCVVLLFVSSL